MTWATPAQRDDIGRTVRRERAKRGWTLAELAAAAGVSVATAHRVECGASGESAARLVLSACGVDSFRRFGIGRAA